MSCWALPDLSSHKPEYPGKNMIGRWKELYNQINTEDSDEKEMLSGHETCEGPLLEQVQRSRLIWAIEIGLALLVIATTTIVVIFKSSRRELVDNNVYLTHVSSITKTNDKPHLCGNSSAEAISLGCSFDQLTWAWLPPNCSHFANGEFLSAEEKPWTYYEDPHGETVVEEEAWSQVLDGELMIFGERREHVTHCVYVFLSLGQLIRDKTPYPPKLVEYAHIHHCAMLLLDIVKKEDTWNDVQTLVGTVSYDQACTAQ